MNKLPTKFSIKQNGAILFFIISLISFPLFGEEEEVDLLGIVVELQGKAYLEKEGEKPEDHPINIGSPIYQGDILFVQNFEDKEGQLFLLDMSGKSRFLITAGRYKLDLEQSKETSLFSQIVERTIKLLGISTIPTGPINRRRSEDFCSIQETFLPFRLFDSKKNTYAFRPKWLNQCLSGIQEKNSTPPLPLTTKGAKLPSVSAYLQLPKEIRSESNSGKWILAQKTTCKVIEPQKIPSQFNKDPITYLIWPYKEEHHLYAFFLFSPQCKDYIQQRIKVYQQTWPDENNSEYLWLLYDLYRENLLHYQSYLTLQKIKSQSSPPSPSIIEGK